MPEISGRARHSCARHRLGGQGLPALPAPSVNRLNFVGRLCQTPTIPGNVSERSRGDASDLDGQAGGRASGRVKRPTIYFSLTALCDR